MSNARPQLVLFSTDPAFLEKLRRFSTDLPDISYETGHGPQVSKKAALDALWTTLMVGVELFGAAPPFAIHEARVLETPSAQLQLGMPRHVVVGVALSKDDPKTPEFNLRLVLSALFKAVKDFNSRSTDQIARVGILPDDLELKKLDPATAFKIVREAYEQHYPQ
jgi:hypothetical protein